MGVAPRRRAGASARATRRPRPTVLSEASEILSGPMSLLLLILGVAIGAGGAPPALRANRGRVRDELTAISADVLAQTGDALAQRLSDQRAIEQERTSGEMARRAEEFKGLVQPVQEKL